MITTKKTAITTFLLLLALLYVWNLSLVDYEWIRTLGTSIAPVMVALVSSKWMYKAYKGQKERERYFWLIFSVALVFHATGNLIWFLGAASKSFYQAPESSYLFWLLAYFLFLVALIYKIRLIRPIMSNTYLFNTIIFLVIVTAIFVHYSVRPYIESAESLFELILIGFLFPIVDIGLIFVTSLLYYLLRHGQERTSMLFFMGAFYLQILGDLLTVIMKTNKDYYQLLIEPIWVGSLLFLGYACIFARREKRKRNRDEASINDKESIFPYISALVLFLLVYHSYLWKINALSLALGIVFFMIIARQLVIIEKNKKLLRNFRDLAYHDSLTGLLNRTSFQMDLESTIKWAKVENSTFFILLIDLDRFKLVNDTLGHFIGDLVLKKSAQILQNSMKEECCIYRVGGDEFVILLKESMKDTHKATANRIIEAFSETFYIDEHEITITPSIGISSYPFNGEDSQSLFKAADTAMYLAKGKGRNNFQLFDSELNEVLTRKMVIESELRKAIQRDELELFYQPKFNLKTNEIMGMEALLRWNSKVLGHISPVEFIPVAEDSGLIISIGEWVMERAFQQNVEWQNKGYPALCISVNVSVQQIQNSNIVKTVNKCLTETGLDPRYVELEITESIMQNVEESKKILAKLSELGVKMALDDFGTGYSSLHILKSLSINTLKIDKSFIDDIKEDDDQSMVKGIIDIAANLNLEIVAEGVEYEHQVRALISYGCPYGQGYFFAKPVAGSQFEELFLERGISRIS